MTFLPVLLFAALAGVNQPLSAAATGTGKNPASQTPLRTPGDAQIERTLKAKLAKSKLAADHFTVSVTKGVATIEGSTNVMQHKGVMTRMAKSSGATSVNNNIRISDSAKSKAVANLAKGRAGPSVADGRASPGAVKDRAASRTSPDPPEPLAPAVPRATVLPSTAR